MKEVKRAFQDSMRDSSMTRCDHKLMLINSLGINLSVNSSICFPFKYEVKLMHYVKGSLYTKGLRASPPFGRHL
jgi:hypothetical protein